MGSGNHIGLICQLSLTHYENSLAMVAKSDALVIANASNLLDLTVLHHVHVIIKVVIRKGIFEVPKLALL